MKRLIFGVLGAFALIGCGGGGGGGSSAKPAHVAYVNASPDAGNLDFFSNGDSKATGVVFGTNSAFADIKAGDYDVSVTPTGSSEVLWSETETYAADQDYISVALGLRNPDLTQDTEREKRLVISLGNVNRTAPTGNRARLLIVHAFIRKAGFSTPSIDFRNPEDTPVVNTTDIDFGATRSIDVDSGSQTFEVQQNGTDQIFATATTTLDPGSVYMALVSGQEDATGDSAPTIRFVKLTTR